MENDIMTSYNIDELEQAKQLINNLILDSEMYQQCKLYNLAVQVLDDAIKHERQKDIQNIQQAFDNADKFRFNFSLILPM